MVTPRKGIEAENLIEFDENIWNTSKENKEVAVCQSPASTNRCCGARAAIREGIQQVGDKQRQAAALQSSRIPASRQGNILAGVRLTKRSDLRPGARIRQGAKRLKPIV